MKRIREFKLVIGSETGEVGAEARDLLRRG